MVRFLTALVFSLFIALPATAQQNAWVQIEAQRTLTGAQDAARGYAAAGVDDVTGFSLNSGWYAVVVGPYSVATADAHLDILRLSGMIPSDSYVVDNGEFRTQFWPAGVTAPLILVEITPPIDDTLREAAEQVVAPTILPAPDETRAQARDSEQSLRNSEKRQLQIALQWAGFYNSTIDGLFGNGTRASMRAWQTANNHAPTGVMTSAQRADLIKAYNAILNGMGLQRVRDDNAGITIDIPTGVVTFAQYDSPFARFDASGDLAAQVLLISQPGDQTRMFGLYEIMQTLAIVPPEGTRSRTNQGFTIEGVNSEIHSYTSVVLENGSIKGFTLVWPAGDEERRRRIVAQMQASFTAIDGVLDPATTRPGEDQSVNLIAGLAVRKPIRDHAGFYINDTGEVLTTIGAVDTCTSITLGLDQDAQVVHLDAALGLAVVRPSVRLAPPAIARFQTAVPRLNTDIAVAGFPYGNLLTTPALTFGTLADIRGLNGEENVKRLSIVAQPGDAGGPVYDQDGAVLGMLLPKMQTNGQLLPLEVSFSLDAEEIMASISGAGLDVTTTGPTTNITPEALTLLAANMTVLVSCWAD